LAEEDEAGEREGPSWKERVEQRIPEAGVGFFGTFLLALAIGFLLAISGQSTLAVIVFAVAIVSILATLLTPSPAARARRAAGEVPPEVEESAEQGEETGEPAKEDRDRPDLIVEAAAAPTSRRRDVPAPPPEPPPMEDVVVDLDSGDEAPAEGNGDVWVE
jgi:hypothetical protein